MKQVKRWRYYCDYCKKSGGSKWHMERHERGCTNNPNRVCGMCSDAQDCADLSELIKIVTDSIRHLETETWSIIDSTTEEKVIASLRELTDCPACILAALRQSGAPWLFPSFDFGKEREEFWRPTNEERRLEGERIGHWVNSSL